MYEIVIDTSVIVSAARSRQGASFQLIRWLRDGRLKAAVSPALVLEYEALLRRQMDDTGWSAAQVDEFLDFVCSAAREVQPQFRLRPVLSDPDDEFVLELAFAGGVDYLVTLNAKDFAGSRAFGVTFITPGDFAKLVREQL